MSKHTVHPNLLTSAIKQLILLISVRLSSSTQFYPLCNSDFKAFLLFDHQRLIDKSLFIKDVLEDPHSIIVLHRARGFGKTFTLHMLRTYLGIELDAGQLPLPKTLLKNPQLFHGGEVKVGRDVLKFRRLKITQCSECVKHLGEYYVLFLDLNLFPTERNLFTTQISALFTTQIAMHWYHTTSNTSELDDNQKSVYAKWMDDKVNVTFSEEEIIDSLRFYTELLYKFYGKKLWVLIDNYDSPFKRTFNTSEHHYIFGVIRDMFDRAFNNNPYIVKVIFAGTRPIDEVYRRLLPHLLDHVSYTLFDEPYSQYYGFTESEVDYLFAEYPLADIEAIHRYYRGYNYGGKTLYNPWNIYNCYFKNATIGNYWVSQDVYEWPDHVLLSDQMLLDLQAIFLNKTIDRPISPITTVSPEPSNIHSFLLFDGYLNPVSKLETTNDSVIYRLSLPNLEVKSWYKLRLLDWLKKNSFDLPLPDDVTRLKSQSIDMPLDYDFVNLLVTEDYENFRVQVQNMLESATFNMPLHQEPHRLGYRTFMLILLDELRPNFTIEYETTDNNASSTAILIPVESYQNHTAVVLHHQNSQTNEFLHSTVDASLQIASQPEYESKIQTHRHIKKILRVGMAFFNRTVALKYTAKPL